MNREISVQGYTIRDGLNEASPLDMTKWAGAGVEIPAAGVSSTTLTYYGSSSETGTYQALHDHDGQAIAPTVAAGKNYEAPPEIFAWPWIKILGDVDDNEDITIVRKS